MKKKVAIIGGGAAGLMAAITSAKNNAEVTIYEKSNRVGKKILATGNGRCNFTNIYASSEFYHGYDKEIINIIFDNFGVQETMNFFEDIGVYPYYGDNGKVYPYSLQAASVLDNLRYEEITSNVSEVTDCNVKELRKNKGQFDIITNKKIYNADSVILCTGGMAGSQFGCSGDGYRIAERLGHKINDIFPALVQLKLQSRFLKGISGVRYDGIVSAYTDDGLIRKEEGEVLFTDYGISGPPVLQISRKVISELKQNKRVYLYVDSVPGMDKSQLFEILSNRFAKLKNRNLVDSLNGFIHKKLIHAMLDTAFDFDGYKGLVCSKLNKKQIYAIVNVMKEWKFEVIGYNGWNQAQTTAGGVMLNDIDLNTLESKKVKGLYFAGEILDIDGDCGGFNLQFAWSSGYIAGLNASKREHK